MANKPSQSHTLPAQLTSFIGREQEIHSLLEILNNEDCRLITIVGMGGTGKTRLSIETAQRTQPQYSDGVYFVPLATIDSASGIPSLIADALEISGSDDIDVQQRVLNFLTGKNLLLVLDNFEHVIDGATFLTEMSRQAPSLRMLVTSRERLNLQEEWSFMLNGLSFSFPEREGTQHHDDALELFEQRAKQLQPGFSLDDNWDDVLAICQLVNGLPLGLELAASLLRVMACSEIREELGKRYDLLSSSARNIDARHQSLRAVFESSWLLLATEEQMALCSLSIFNSGFTREAGLAVGQTSTAILSALVDKSLIRRNHAGRFDMHELLRQFAAEKLTEDASLATSVQKCHSEYFLQFASSLCEKLTGSEQLNTLRKVETEAENLRMAISRAISENLCAELASAVDVLGVYLSHAGRHQDGLREFQSYIERLKLCKSDQSQLWLELHIRSTIWLARFCLVLGEFDQASSALAKADILLAKGTGLTESVCNLLKAHLLVEKGRVVERVEQSRAAKFYEQALVLYRTEGTLFEESNTLLLQGRIAFESSNYEQATELLLESLNIRIKLQDIRGMAESSAWLGFVKMLLGYMVEARSLVEKSVNIYNETGMQSSIARGLRDIAGIYQFSGDFEKAISTNAESLALYQQLGDQRNVMEVQFVLALGLVLGGKYEEAMPILQETSATAMQVDFQWGLGWSYCLMGQVYLAKTEHESAKKQLNKSADAFHKNNHTSEAMMAHALLAYIFHQEEQAEKSRQYLTDALSTSIALKSYLLSLNVLSVSAAIIADNENYDYGKSLYAVAEQYPLVGRSAWFNTVFGKRFKSAISQPEMIEPDLLNSTVESLTSVFNVDGNVRSSQD